MDAAHDAQHFLSSVVCSAACFAAKTRDFLVDIAKVSIKFGANFVRDTRRAPAETVQKSQEGAARVSKHLKCFCAPLPRAARTFRAKIAEFFGRKSDQNRTILRAKFSNSARWRPRTHATTEKNAPIIFEWTLHTMPSIF